MWFGNRKNNIVSQGQRERALLCRGKRLTILVCGWVFVTMTMCEFTVKPQEKTNKLRHRNALFVRVNHQFKFWLATPDQTWSRSLQSVLGAKERTTPLDKNHTVRLWYIVWGYPQNWTTSKQRLPRPRCVFVVGNIWNYALIVQEKVKCTTGTTMPMLWHEWDSRHLHSWSQPC